jgi:2-oxoglutarate ferredoxin oxidoreductase subunit delta
MTTKQYNGIKVEGCGKGRANWYLFTELCKGCGLCITKCPLNAKGDKCLDWSKEVGLYATPAVQPNPETCTACGACELVCPDSAIRVEKNA